MVELLREASSIHASLKLAVERGCTFEDTKDIRERLYEVISRIGDAGLREAIESDLVLE